MNTPDTREKGVHPMATYRYEVRDGDGTVEWFTYEGPNLRAAAEHAHRVWGDAVIAVKQTSTDPERTLGAEIARRAELRGRNAQDDIATEEQT